MELAGLYNMIESKKFTSKRLLEHRIVASWLRVLPGMRRQQQLDSPARHHWWRHKRGGENVYTGGYKMP